MSAINKTELRLEAHKAARQAQALINTVESLLGEAEYFNDAAGINRIRNRRVVDDAVVSIYQLVRLIEG